MDCHPEEGLILTSSKDLSVRVWRAATGRCLARAEGHVDAVGAVAVAPRGAAFCVSGSGDKCGPLTRQMPFSLSFSLSLLPSPSHSLSLTLSPSYPLPDAAFGRILGRSRSPSPSINIPS